MRLRLPMGRAAHRRRPLNPGDIGFAFAAGAVASASVMFAGLPAILLTR